MSNATRQASYKARQRAAGKRALTLWVSELDALAITRLLAGSAETTPGPAHAWETLQALFRLGPNESLHTLEGRLRQLSIAPQVPRALRECLACWEALVGQAGDDQAVKHTLRCESEEAAAQLRALAQQMMQARRSDAPAWSKRLMAIAEGLTPLPFP